MPWTAEELSVFLSEHLLKDSLEPVVRELQEVQAGRGMVVADHEDSLLQGDVYEGVPCVRRQGELAITPQRVMLVSNSCDATPDNPRPIPLDLTVAPVLRLSRYRDLLAASGKATDAQIADMVNSIKRQEKTHLVYLPAGGNMEEEMVALLDKVQSLPAPDFHGANPRRLAVLTDRGFWIFLVKLSMHFLRPHEGVQRATAH